ncbi:MAG: Rne/Rng family ribonuclease, partial [Acidobacteria bacterium]
MNQEIIVNSTSHETRIALLENSQLSEVYVERNFDRGIVGNIYKGRVTRVLPGMQSAFVDIGFERDAFLYVGDISEDLLKVEDFLEEEDGDVPEETEEEAIPTGSLHIEDLLQEGQQILVQVAKEPIGTKGPRITAHISLPGRYIVFMPTINHIGISRKIEGHEEKERLKAIISSLKTGNRGYIVRTAGEGMEKVEFAQDINFLHKLWKEIVQKTETVSAPCLIHEELGLIQKIVRDAFCEETSLMLVDSETAFQKALQFIDKIDHNWASRIRLYSKKRPIFDEYEVESQLEAALNSKVWLKSGGYIVINQTEALVAIDVNTGRYIGKHSLEETVFKTNMEALKEIVRQIRLRNLGGIIVIDFIDMEESEHRKTVLDEFTEQLKSDRSRSNILTIDEIGLVALT